MFTKLIVLSFSNKMFLKIISKLMFLGYQLTFHFFKSQKRQNNNDDIGLFASYII